ncbi:hypothetical protein [Spiroplasma endosymbiont of Tricholauxania praeusta]|uniref:hypothetical protein n=1 Tax=Spiroplasma endosymbiont of Tricholauxania praeusta TaxID=3066296 RepID=UPI0030CD27A6
MAAETYIRKLKLSPTFAFTTQQIRSLTKEQREAIDKKQTPVFTMEQMRTFTLEQMEQLAIDPDLIAEAMRLSEEEAQVELAKKLSLEKEKQSDIIVKEFKETSMPSSQTFKVETEKKLVTEEEILKQGVRPKGSKIIQPQIQHTNNNHQEKVIISEPTISPSLYESSLDLQATNEDDEFGFVVVDEPYKTLQSEEVSEKEREDIDRAIALEALSLKRQERNNKAIGLYLEEQEELEKSVPLSLQSEEVSEKEREDIDRAIALSLQDQFNVEQEQEDIDRAITLEALSLKREERNNKAIGLYLEEQEELEKSAKRQSNLMQVIKKSEIEEIKVLEQQKINKILNFLIKLVTFGKINKNKKIEIEISQKWKKYQNHVVKNQKQIQHYFQNHLEKLLINNK